MVNKKKKKQWEIKKEKKMIELKKKNYWEFKKRQWGLRSCGNLKREKNGRISEMVETEKREERNGGN